MGAGKTSIGRKLASRLGYWFIDTDHAIAEIQGSSITEIFNTCGEGAFRRMETVLLRRLISVQNSVIATGGGILISEGNWELIRRIGMSIYLKADINELFKRATRTRKRPLLQTENPLQTFIDLFEQRRHLYEQADLHIKAGAPWQKKVVNTIIQNL